jgi:hypothetical protein
MSDRLLQFFVSDHLPPAVQKISLPFDALATQLIATCPPTAERTVTLRKLLEAKDAAVRMVLDAGDV